MNVRKPLGTEDDIKTYDLKNRNSNLLRNKKQVAKDSESNTDEPVVFWINTTTDKINNDQIVQLVKNEIGIVDSDIHIRRQMNWRNLEGWAFKSISN